MRIVSTREQSRFPFCSPPRDSYSLFGHICQILVDVPSRCGRNNFASLYHLLDVLRPFAGRLNKKAKASRMPTRSRSMRVAATALLSLSLWTGMVGLAHADQVKTTTVSTATSSGCTGKLIKRTERLYSVEHGYYTGTSFYATVSCPTLAAGKQARARAHCSGLDRYTSWAIRGESWQSGNCFGSGASASKVSLEFR